jgi:hypothetical protein
MLSISAPPGQTALVFAAVFVIVWLGAAIVTLNAQLLGGTMYCPPPPTHTHTHNYHYHHPLRAKPVRLRLTVPLHVPRSFFQSVCVLGYCVFPLNIAAFVCLVMKPVVNSMLLRLILVGVGFAGSTRGERVPGAYTDGYARQPPGF